MYHLPLTPFKLQVPWGVLSEEQKYAAGVFGYDCYTWEYYLGPDNSGIDECIVPYYQRNWHGLPSEQKRAAKLLGYNQTTWDEDADLGFPANWQELTAKQMALFEELGWTEASYNTDFDNYDWASLPSTLQKAAVTLHFNQESWDDCSAYGLSSCNLMPWNTLTTNQKNAAGELGYSCYDYEDGRQLI